MVFTRPTLEQLLERTRSDVAARMGLDALQPRSVLRVLADVLGGTSHELHGRLDFVARQVFVDSATGEYLDRAAGVWQVNRKAAAYAAGQVTFTGTSGKVIPAGTLLHYQVNGWEFATLSSVSIAGGTALASVVAVNPGSGGNLAAATTLVLSQTVAGVEAEATVAAPGLAGGASRESDEDLRARLLQRIRAPFQGGSADNYVSWALAEPGVTRAWALPNHQGLGSVGVTFVRDDDPGGIVPDASEVASVQAAIDLLRPVTANVIVFAPAVELIDITASITPNTAAVKAAAETSLADLINRETEPGGTLYLSHLREAISTAEGELDHVLTTPAADVVAAGGAIHQLGPVTWL